MLRLFDPDREDPIIYRVPQSNDSRHWTPWFYVVCVALAALIGMTCIGHCLGAEIEELTRYGTPDQEWASRGGYLVSYDGRTRCPRWVLEKLDADQLAVRVIRDGQDFRADQAVPAEVRVGPADYRGSGFDIGHLAPAAVHRTSQQDLESTFLFSNAVPQPRSVNAGVWLALENEVASQAKASSVWVITAPLWFAEDNGELRVRTIGRRTVWVPTHVGKAVLVEERQRVDRLRAWVIPNNVEACRGKRFHDFQVRVDEFEIRSGLNVFSALPDELEEQLEGASP